ncbi:MAG: ABC transporter permease [Candidatus Nanohaloarchaea archaeon]
MILELAELSGKNLFRRGKRSWLTVIGVIIGITAIVALFSLGQGLEDSVTQEFQDLGANTIYILPGSGLQGVSGGGSDAGEGLEESDLEAVRRTGGVGEAGPVINAQTTGEFRGEQQRVPLLGIPTDSSQEMIMRTNSLEVDKGRDIRSTDQFSGLAGYELVQGDIFEYEVGLRSQVNVRDTDIRVVGTMEQSGDPDYDRSLVMPLEAVRDIVDDEDRTDFIIAEVSSGEPDEVADDIEEEIRNERNVREGEEDFTVSTADNLLDSFLGILNLVQYIVLGIVSIALFVGGLGIMNTMYMSVSERTKEIGIMKALGATKRQILSIYLVEAGVIGLIGGIIGIALGLGISEIAFYFIRDSVGIPLRPTRSPLLIGGSLGASVLLGMLSGYLPARKAANLEPVEAIRQE